MSNDIQSISQSNYVLHNIDAKKLYVQEPLFTANSGDAVYVGWRPDETVLWSGEPQKSTNVSSTYPLSEDIRNFEKFKVIINPWDQQNQAQVQRPMQEFTFDLRWNTLNNPIYAQCPAVGIGGQQLVINYWYITGAANTTTALGLLNGSRWSGSTYSNQVSTMSGSLVQIIGVNRISGGNS